MYQTLVALFKNGDDVKHAHAELLERGFNKANIVVEPAEHRAEHVSANANTVEMGDDYRGEIGAGGFFRSLLGFERSHDEESIYREYVQRGGCVLVVNVADLHEARRAEDILQRHGSTEINARAESFEAGQKNSSSVSSTASNTDTSTQVAAASQAVPLTPASTPVAKPYLDAASQTTQVGTLRRHELDTQSVHEVIGDGGRDRLAEHATAQNTRSNTRANSSATSGNSASNGNSLADKLGRAADRAGEALDKVADKLKGESR